MKYPIGIQDFESLRTDGYSYVDKTGFVYKLVSEGRYYFLSRPRRFGKSLLLSTLKAYFEGKRELFDGLAIAGLEREWKKYPVFHLDLNTRQYVSRESLIAELSKHLEIWESECGIDYRDRSVEERFFQCIYHAARKSSAGKVVILVDEYDKPLLETIGSPELQEEYRQILKAFYANIKSCDEYIRFAFLTGVTKFSHLTIFSGLNNLNDISMLPQYAEICGITEEELRRGFDAGVESLACANGLTKEQCYARLEKEYDGYHFVYGTVGLYNPFSLLNTLAYGLFRRFWFATGTPTFLVEVLRRSDYPLYQIASEGVKANTMDSLDVLDISPIPLLFQSGYLTIKGYDARFDSYRLGFPNAEVEVGFVQFLAAYYRTGDGNGNFAIDQFVRDVESGDVEGFMTRLQSFYADSDYRVTGKLEVYFQNSLMTIFKLMGFYTQVERHTSRGRMDVTIQTRDYVYIMELKVDKSADEALRQIEERQYALPFATDKRKLFKVGVCFGSKTHCIDEWKVE